MSFGTPGLPDDPLQADAGLGPTELTPWAAPGPLAAAGPGGRPLPPGLAGPPGPADYLRGLRRRWGLALFGGLTCAVAAALAAWFFVPTKKYTASALLQVKMARPSILETNDLQASHDYVTYQKTQESLVTSTFVISAALGDPADPNKPNGPTVAQLSILRDERDPVEWIRERLDTQFRGELMEISLSGNQPQEIAAVVNGVVDAYLNDVVNKERNNRLERLETLKKIHDQRQKNLEAPPDAPRPGPGCRHERSGHAGRHAQDRAGAPPGSRADAGPRPPGSDPGRGRAQCAGGRDQGRRRSAGPLAAGA